MARYYCEYCQSYLTHDTLSVRKSHLIGKHHLKYVSDYYQNKFNEELKRASKTRTKKKRYYNNRISPIFKLSVSKNKNKVKGKEVGKTGKEIKKTKPINKLKDPFDMSKSSESILSKIYYLSPGYNKVFIPSNRFDIGDMIKTSQLPQRANIDASHDYHNRYGKTREKGEKSENGRDTIFNSSLIYSSNNKNETGNNLPPPMIISKWSNTIPKEQIYYQK